MQGAVRAILRGVTMPKVINLRARKPQAAPEGAVYIGDRGGPRPDFTYTFLSSVPATRRSPSACAVNLS